MGEVFLAFDERLERRVAIKRVRWGPRRSPQLHERFRREARAAARLNHPAIVQVYDLIADGDGDAIVMEYVLGRPLSTLIGDPILTPALAVRLAREVAEGLAHAHAAGFVHRDLKAENVMMTGAGHAKILDFGIAKLVAGGDEESLTADGAVLGTYRSMSPEQAEGGEVDERSDLFSLGVLLYEMLSGQTPFHGDNPLAILKRVLAETPPPLSVYHADLPPALTGLVDRLLAKNREARPRNAEEVARSLSEIADLPDLTVATPREGALAEGLSDLPTGPAARLPLRDLKAAPPSTSRMAVLKRQPRAAVAALVLAVAALGGGLLYWRGCQPSAPLRVLVPHPAVPAGSDPRLALAASGVLDAALGSLASLQGLAPLGPEQLGGMTGTPVDMARATAADEVLLAAIEPEGELAARVRLSRLAGSDGGVRWIETFKVSSDPADLRQLADAVAVFLHRAYSDHLPRPGVPSLAFDNADYAAYLALRQRLDGGQAPEEPELAKIEEIVQRSPRFLAAQITATDLGLALFNSTREPRYLERAQAFAQQAAALAPGDPRPLALQFRTAIERGDSREAEAAFARLAAALPGDPAVRLYHSSLAALRGHGDEALDDLRNATDHIPSWRNLYRLADLERRSGRLADARKHLELLHARAPRNLWGLEALAKLELDYGNPERAERLYRDLLLHAPKERALWTCLGLSQALAGRHETALASYRSALAIAPDHIAVLLNLADSELALGRRSEAEAHYRRVLDRLAVLESAASLRPDDRLVKAQCLAHLGRAEEAVAIVQQTLRQGPGSPDLVYAAALVYALVGDRTSALLNAREALRLGEGASWFRLAPFQFIRDDPELRTQFSARALP